MTVNGYCRRHQPRSLLTQLTDRLSLLSLTSLVQPELSLIVFLSPR